jgi:hypothetical protein
VENGDVIMTNTNQKRAKKFAEKFVQGFASKMEDVSMQGPKFTWEGFPGMCATLAEVYFLTNWPHQPLSEIDNAELEPLVRKLAQEAGEKYVADRLSGE